MRHTPSAILGRVVTVVAVLVLVGLIIRIVGAILSAVLPDALVLDLNSGFNMLYGFVSPGMAAIMAGVILVALVWVITGRRG
jgi:hypothetical protein